MDGDYICVSDTQDENVILVYIELSALLSIKYVNTLIV